MSSRIQWLFQGLALVVGLTGASLKKFLPLEQPYGFVWYTVVVVSLFVLFAISTRRDANRYTGKDMVNTAWRTMVAGATQSVDIFAGDASWSESNKEIIAARCLGNGGPSVMIQVICRWPKPDVSINTKQIRDLLLAGAEVRFYSGQSIKIRGLVVDGTEGREVMTALTVRKVPKVAIQLSPGQPGSDATCDYTARRYVYEEDRDYVSSLQMLFSMAWPQLYQGLVLEEEVRYDAKAIAGLLRTVPHYAKIASDHVDLKQVTIGKLYAAGKYVKSRRIARISGIIEGYKRYGIELLKPCRLTTCRSERLLLPPIVEEHEGKLVVIDGHHRIWSAVTKYQMKEVWCIVLTGLTGLPGEPLPFADQQVSSDELDRENVFIGYNAANFRDIYLLDAHLRAVCVHQD